MKKKINIYMSFMYPYILTEYSSILYFMSGCFGELQVNVLDLLFLLQKRT